MDEVDIANDRAMMELERKIAEMRARPQTIAPPLCIQCDEPNAPARRALGLSRCIDCQRRLEVRSRSHSMSASSG